MSTETETMLEYPSPDEPSYLSGVVGDSILGGLSIKCNGTANIEVLTVNVGGRRAKLPVQKLASYGGAVTSKLSVFARKSHIERLTDCDGYFEDTGEYYFERSPVIFDYVLDYYNSGKLHRPFDICPMRVRYELDFWRIPLSVMSLCCTLDENNNAGPRATSQSTAADNGSFADALLLEKLSGTRRRKLYLLLENPRSSSAAKVFSILSASFVLLSLAGLILSSMPELQEADGEPHFLLNWLEKSCMAWFTLEYIARFSCTPEKKKFMSSPLNIIDLLTVVPFVIEAFLEQRWMKEFRGAMLVIRVMRLARVARIFKLARYSTGLRAFGETMKKSAAELSMLGMFLVTGIMLFSTAIYFFERDEPNSKFYSIPASCWWCVITMTTVGYGDLVPVTTGGKVVAAVASVCGIIVLAFPISMIIDKFAESTGHWNTDEEEAAALAAGKKKSGRKHLF